MPRDDKEIAFELVCERLNALKSADVPDRSTPFAVVYGEQSISWFEDFQAASVYARQHFEPETYAIGNPSLGPDFLPMFFVQKPLAL